MAEHAMSGEIRTSVEAMEAAAIPRSRVARACDELGTTAEGQPLPDNIASQPVEDKSPAQWAYERLILYIKNFEEQLDDQHEVAMGFAGGEAGVLRIEGIGYFAPDIVTFYGRDEGDTRTQLIQHVAQLNVMLRAMPRTDKEEQPRRIGFRLVSELEDKPAARRKDATRAQGRSRARDRG